VTNAKAKILIVDDDQAVCNMLKKFLTKEGYQTTSVLTGQEGIKKVRQEEFQAVLLDIKLPDIDGLEVLKRIREFYKKIIIVMITAVKDDEVGRKCLDFGADDYIIKPLGLTYLKNVLLVKLLNFKNKK